MTGQAPLIETTQSKVANTIETTEVQNLPMITRTISGMLELLPGAAPVAPLHRTKENVGTVSYAGSLGRQRGDERGRRRQPRQPLQRTAADVHDREPGAVPARVEPVHGGGRPHGRRGGHAGDEVRDERAARIGLHLRARQEPDREGLLHETGGRRKGAVQPAAVRRIDRRPVIRNQIFFFGAIEQQREDIGRFVPENLYNELDVLVRATSAGQLAPGFVNPDHPRIGSSPAAS